MLGALVLTALVAWAALAVAVRARLDGRAETLVATTVLACGLVLGPIYALGLLGALARGSVAAAVLTLSAAAWLAASIGPGVGAHARDTWSALVGLARMPFEGLREAWVRRSAVFACLAACLALFVWNALAAWLAPSWREWDALWYHESIVGYTIQNHGFAVVDLPTGGMQKINGYPRAAEMLSLWLALWAGRALVDLPNVLLMPAFFASTYALARRLTRDRVASAGWASVACTIPAYLELLQSTYVDPAMATFITAGAMLVLRAPARAREALFGALALAVAANVKVSGVFPVLPLALLATVGLLIVPGARRAGLLTAGAGAGIIVAFSAATYLRNLHAFHNPVWPDLHVRAPALGIDWPGNSGWGEVRSNSRSGVGVMKNAPLGDLLQQLFLPPGRLTDDERKYTHLYGLGVPWVLLPAAGLVFGRLALVLVRGVRNADVATRRKLALVVSLLVTSSVMLLTSTNRSTPRYQLACIALWVPVVAWSIGRRRALQEALAFAATVGGLAITAYEAPAWRGFPASPASLFALWRLDPPLREMTPELGGTVLRVTGQARETELGAGAVVLSDDFVFPSVLWNDAYSNRVVQVRRGTDLASTADRLGARWIVASDDGAAKKLRGNPAWRDLGPLYVEGWGSAFTRVAAP